MGNKKLKNRNEIDPKYQWNIQAMYANAAAWEKDIEEVLQQTADFSKFQGHLTESPDMLLDAFTTKDAIWQKLERAYVYARMKLDEDNRVSAQQAMYDKVSGVIAKVSAAMSFMTPELLSASEETLRSFIKELPALSQYTFVIEDLIREKKHVLSKEEENILAQLSEVTDAPDTIFTMLNNADISFGTIKDEDGEEVSLTHGNFISFMESHDRNVRKSAFTHVYEAYKGLVNTIASAYNYNVKTDVIGANIRHYDSARAAALSGGNIPESVYDNLITVVHEYLPVLHRYIDLRKKVLAVDELKMYDIYVPLVEIPKRKVSFEEAIKIMEEGLAPLGNAYMNRVLSGIDAGWIDVYENEGKTSGAYSFGSYDSFPYILLNFRYLKRCIYAGARNGSLHARKLHKRNSAFYLWQSLYLYGRSCLHSQ